MNRSAAPQRTSHTLTARLLYGVVALAFSWLAFANGQGAQATAFFVALAMLAAAGAVFKMGWLPLTTIVGILVGLIADSGVKGGTHESQMWETVSTIVGGALGGMAIGFYLDARSRVMSRLDAPPNSPGNVVK